MSSTSSVSRRAGQQIPAAQLPFHARVGRLAMKYPAAGIFLLCLLVFMANGRPQPEVDCVPAPYTAWSLVRHASSDLQVLPAKGVLGGTIRVRADGSWGSMYPPGSAWAAFPSSLRSPSSASHRCAPVTCFTSASWSRPSLLPAPPGSSFSDLLAAGAGGGLACHRPFRLRNVPLQRGESGALDARTGGFLALRRALFSHARSNEPSTASYLRPVGFALGMAGATRPSTIFFTLSPPSVPLHSSDVGGSSSRS